MSDAGYTRIKGADALLPTVEGIHRNRQHFGFHCDHSSIILSKFGTKKGFFQVIHWYDSNAFHSFACIVIVPMTYHSCL